MRTKFRLIESTKESAISTIDKSPFKFFYFSLIVIYWSCSSTPSAETIADPWLKMDTILNLIQPPEFPDRSYSVIDFGASNDGEQDARNAIQKCIDKCAADGGGRVIIPAGNYLINGPIHLDNHVNLHLEENAYVRFGVYPDDYLPPVRTRWEGMDLMNYSALVYAYGKNNIAITGQGTLDGQASEQNWWPWKGLEQYGWKEGMPNQESENGKHGLLKMNGNRTPIDQRVFGSGSYLRPNMIQLFQCQNILIDGVTLKNSPMWVMHPVLSENITIKDVKVISHGPNSDGCDPESCKNVLIENCFFDTGDDCIALKSGRNEDGRSIGKPIENVIIKNCRMKDGHGGVVIGSEVSGGARNIFATDCLMDSPNLQRAIRIKTNKVRGGTLENLYFRNLDIKQVTEAVVKINANYTIDNKSADEFIPEIRNIFVTNIKSDKSKYGVLIDGYDEKHPINNVTIEDCQFNGVSDGNPIKNIANLTIKGVYVNGEAWK